MRYKIIYTKTAFNDIQKLDRVVKKRIKKKIEEYATDPIKSAKKLLHPKIGSYRWRIGNYEVMFDVNKTTIIVLRVGHRREIYK